MTNFSLSLPVLLLWFMPVFACANISEVCGDERELFASIFNGYNRNVRPRKEATETVKVLVEFELNGLNGIVSTSVTLYTLS